MNNFILEVCERNDFKRTLKLLEITHRKGVLRHFERFVKFKKMAYNLPKGKLSFEVC